ncbi:MAG: glycosyltransferase family 39 protein [Cyanobacteria bacterium P01_E01_bin.35]
MRFAIKNLYWIDISILLLALIVTLLGIGSYGLYEPHEGHFAMVGQEMIWRNDWVTPHLNGSPYLNKPPLLYWLIAITTGIFGSSESSARLPVAIAGWIGIVIAWKWTRELWGIKPSRTVVLMLSVTLGWFIFTHQILIDVLLGTLLISSNYFLWRLLYQPQSRWNWWGTYVSLSLCVLTKGLIGVLFPLCGCLALTVIRSREKIIGRIRLYQGLLLMLLLILPWFIAIERANPGFWHYFVVNEHFDRLLDRRFPPDYEVSKVSIGGYLAITACWCYPWVLFLPSVIKSTWKEWHQGLSGNASLSERKHSDAILLLAAGAILPVIIFLPLSSRLIYYSIPAIPPYVILCAGWWDKLYQTSNNHELKPSSSVIDYSIPEVIQPSPTGILCKSSSNFVSCGIAIKAADFYSAIALILATGFYGATAMIPWIVSLLPAVLPTPEITKLIAIVTIALGTGWLVTGLALMRRLAQAWIPLCITLMITYLAIIKGFSLYENVRSSKNLVQQANSCLSIDTLWIFEGSREIGAAGAIGYYLNQAQTALSGVSVSEPKVVQNQLYRTILILSDGGENRLPPEFPGTPPEYLISRAELQTYWDRDRPVVFLTDFLRQPNDLQDPLSLNLPQGVNQPYITSGQRRLYLNQAATKLTQEKCH